MLSLEILMNAPPPQIMHSFLEQFVAESIGSGLEIILILDANGLMVKGKLAQKLQSLGLVEA